MSQIQKFTVAPGQTEFTFRLQKSAHHLYLRRTSTLAAAVVGLMAGFPEKITAEISHPVRSRVQPADRVPLAHIVAWAQFGRGPIQESANAAGLANLGFGKGTSREIDQRVESIVIFYLNDLGPVELLADDQFNITLTNLVPDATYEVFAPELPILPEYATRYYAYEQSLILEGDRDKVIYTKDLDGLIIPNNVDAITRININWAVDGDRTKEQEYSLFELMQAQAEANPSFVEIQYLSSLAKDLDTDSPSSYLADFLVLDTKKMVSVTIYTVLGERVEYTAISVEDRNLA